MLDLINPLTVRAGLTEQCAPWPEFDGKTRPCPILNLLNSHSLREDIMNALPRGGRKHSLLFLDWYCPN